MLSAEIGAILRDFKLACALSVERGKTLAVVGENGAGKTTALRCIAGLVRPQSGFIRFDEQIWFDADRRLNVAAQNRDCSMVFACSALFGHLSVYENVAFGLRAAGCSPQIIREQTDRMLGLFEVSHFARRRAGLLSSGEAQRVALARALAPKPAVLLLDEPLSALDLAMRPTIRQTLRCYLAAEGVATIIVTHDSAEALLFTDDLAIMERGTIVQRGSPQNLRQRPASRYVAAFAGTNVYAGIARPLEHGTTAVKVEEAEFVVAGSWSGPVAVSVDPEAVILSALPVGSSARNSLHGAVSEIASELEGVRVTLSSKPAIVARVTTQAAQELHLEIGHPLYATFKAHEVHVH